MPKKKQYYAVNDYPGTSDALVGPYDDLPSLKKALAEDAEYGDLDNGVQYELLVTIGRAEVKVSRDIVFDAAE